MFGLTFVFADCDLPRELTSDPWQERCKKLNGVYVTGLLAFLDDGQSDESTPLYMIF